MEFEAQIAKLIENQGSNRCQYCFANISPMRAWILMIFYVVVYNYVVSLNFKLYKDLCKNASARLVKGLRAVKKYPKIKLKGCRLKINQKLNIQEM